MSTEPNPLEQVERAILEQSRQVYVLRLYVSGATPKSVEAIRNVKNLCDINLAGRYELEVVDIYQQPERAALDQVVAVPMLVKQFPLPLRRLVGTLSNPVRLLEAFGVIKAAVDLVAGADRG